MPSPSTTTVVDGASFIDELLAGDTTAPAVPGPAAVEIAFTVKRFILQLLLERAITVVPTRDVMPVLKNAQFDVRANRLRVIASDTELSMIASTELVTV